MPPPKDPIKYEEYRRKISEARKKRFEDPIKGEATRRKMSEAQKKRYEDPIKGEETRRKISEAKKRLYEDPIKGGETRRKMSEANKLRAPPSEVTRQKMSEALTKRFEDPEVRLKQSEAMKKRYEDPEVRMKQSEAMKGEKNAFFGKKHSEATRQKMGEAWKLRAPASEATRQKMGEALKKHYEDPIKGGESRRKMSEARKGEKNSNYGKKMSDEQRQKISEANKGNIVSEETREKLIDALKKRYEDPKAHLKLSEAQKGRRHSRETRTKMSESQKGEKGSGWKGGISFLPYCQKFNEEFKERVRAFFDHQCIECGTPQKGKKLGVHHVNFDKQSCCNDTLPLFVPLCSSCHSKTNYNREYWEQHFTEMINKYYGGKCYYLKEEMSAIERERMPTEPQ